MGRWRRRRDERTPIYVTGGDGVARVIGALAYGSGDQANVMAGVTPIEQMIDSNSGLRANARAVGSPSPAPVRRFVMVRDRAAARVLEARAPDRVALYPLTRWAAAGVSSTLMRPLARKLARSGIRLTSIAPREPRPSVPLVPGASLTALLADGDIAVGAIGTVTYVDGPTVLGFGHSFIGAGRSRFLMGDAYVYQTIAAPLWGSSYKVAEPGTLQGMIVGDRTDGITGRIGPVDGITGVATATNASRGTESTVRVTLAPDERTAPDLSSILQDEPALRVTDGASSGTLTLRISIWSPDLPRPFVYRNVYAAADNVVWMAGGQLPSLMYSLMGNGIRPVPISAIDVRERLEPRVRAARIIAAGVRGRVRSGQRASLVLRVQPWRASQRLVRISVRLPEGVDASSPVLRIVPKSSGGFYEPSGDYAIGSPDSARPIGPRPAVVRRAARFARRATGTRLEQVMSGLARATDDRHDAVRLLAEGDDAGDPSAGVTVPVPYVIYDGSATTRVRFRPTP